VPSKKSAINSILGVSDESSTLEERLRKRRAEPAEEAPKERKGEESSKRGSREGGGETTAEERALNESAQKERTARKREPDGRRGGGLHARTLSLKLDTETEQTAKASYYLTPEQTKKLDDLRAAFRHEGGYAPRDASYSRIVGLAIERLHEEIFSSGSCG
jgi:hypothetical protein